MFKLFFRVVTNGTALYIIPTLLEGFVLEEGFRAIFIGALVLTFLNSFIKPALQLVFKPLIWITFGFFNLVINLGILWLADQLLPQLAVSDLTTLFWASIIISFANLF